MIQLNHRDAMPIYAQIIERFKELICAGILDSGERLPSVRELAAELAINPNTIQRSYRQLEAEGWIITVPGRGCFVSHDGRRAEEEKRKLLTQFDAAVEALTAFGISREELAARLREGGNTYA